MKRSSLFIFIMFFFTCSSLFAQTYRKARIFVPPVAGIGIMEENVFFYNKLTYEVVLQYRELVRLQRSSDYILRGSIMTVAELTDVEEKVNANDLPDTGPVPPVGNSSGWQDFFSSEVDGSVFFYDPMSEENQPLPAEDEQEFYEGEYVFLLEMIDNKTEEVIAKQHIVYTTPDESVGDLLSIVVYNFLSVIPDIEEEDDIRERWLFINTSALWSPRLYFSESESIYWLNFGVYFATEFHFYDYMSLEFGFQLLQDWVVVSRVRNEEYRDLMLEIPIALKFVYKPVNYNYMLEPYGGVSFNFSLRGETKPSSVSWITGLQFAIKAGSGMVVIDPRFSADFKNSSIVANPIDYQRYMLQIGIGYKFGLFPKKDKTPF